MSDHEKSSDHIGSNIYACALGDLFLLLHFSLQSSAKTIRACLQAETEALQFPNSTLHAHCRVYPPLVWNHLIAFLHTGIFLLCLELVEHQPMFFHIYILCSNWQSNQPHLEHSFAYHKLADKPRNRNVFICRFSVSSNLVLMLSWHYNVRAGENHHFFFLHFARTICMGSSLATFAELSAIFLTPAYA